MLWHVSLGRLRRTPPVGFILLDRASYGFDLGTLHSGLDGFCAQELVVAIGFEPVLLLRVPMPGSMRIVCEPSWPEPELPPPMPAAPFAPPPTAPPVAPAAPPAAPPQVSEFCHSRMRDQRPKHNRTDGVVGVGCHSRVTFAAAARNWIRYCMNAEPYDACALIRGCKGSLRMARRAIQREAE